jgi:SHS2 domain-containing protein
MTQPADHQPVTETGYEVVDHTADWALRVRGRDLKELLANAARGMTTLLVGELDNLAADEERFIELEAYDAETMLVDWLSELAYLAESELLAFREFELHEAAVGRLRATVRGGRAQEMIKHIKAVTYHDLAIVATAEGLEATVVFDV